MTRTFKEIRAVDLDPTVQRTREVLRVRSNRGGGPGRLGLSEGGHRRLGLTRGDHRRPRLNQGGLRVCPRGDLLQRRPRGGFEVVFAKRPGGGLDGVDQPEGDLGRPGSRRGWSFARGGFHARAQCAFMARARV